MNLIVTGEVGAGKTSWCRRYISWLAKRKISAGGVLCPATFTGNARTGYDVEDLHSGKKVIFGRKAQLPGSAGEKVGRYILSSDGIDFASQAVRAAVKNGCDVIFLDEIGPLEMEGKGLAEVAKFAYQNAPHTVTVVRKVLLPSFIKLFAASNPEAHFVTQDISLDAEEMLLPKDFDNLCKTSFKSS